MPARSELKRLFLAQLLDIHDAERRIAEALPQMIDAAENPELRERLGRHLDETARHARRLEEILDAIGAADSERQTCEAAKGLVREAESLLETFRGSAVIDAAIACAAQKIERYEIATYRCLCAWAERLGYSVALGLLQETLAEEKRADRVLDALGTARSGAEAKA